MSEPKLAVLGMPGYGNQTAAAGRGYWLASRGSQAARPLSLTRHYSCGSLLASNFNKLWCTALNLCHKGQCVDYFAMLHDDVEPDDFWLDTLIEELEAKQLDVLGVPVPIKDSHGLTSLALHKEGDDWFPKCRLTLKEVHQLPETFTSEDVGAPLLLNTGCWVCRFDPEWAKKVHFTINDRIIFDKSQDMYLANVEPEDWFFSRLCHELGLKIGATRKVKVDHAGSTRFRNDVPWGDDFDTAYLSESALPHRIGFRFPSEIDGWLTADEGRGLAKIASGKRVLEIGSYCGRSTVCLAQTAESVTSVDPHDGRDTPKPKDTYQELQNNLLKYGVWDKVHCVRSTLQDATFSSDARFDLIFIDGGHHYAAVKADIDCALPLLSEGGLLAFHDYRTKPGEHDGRWDADVTHAVNELVESGGALLERHGTVAVVRPPVLVGA